MAARVVVCLSSLACGSQAPPAGQWDTYGGDAGGTRFARSTQITSANVSRLRPAWVAHTGALASTLPNHADAAFEATPILFEDVLYLSSPFDQVLALDPANGRELWRYDPKIGGGYRSIVTSRGVVAWGSAKGQHACTARIFVATLDARLIALDARTGQPCTGFGSGGSVDLARGMAVVEGDEFEVTSAPTVVGDVVVTGSSIGDDHAVDEERGSVRGFDARTGRELWRWDPLPWAEGQHPRTGAANAWSTIAADIARGIVYVPTSSASPDFYGGARPGDDRDADSVVALDAKTGRKLWSFQVVHHNLWDYDLAAEPLLFELHGTVPAIAVATKMGTVFVLNRVTGVPLYPVTEVPVPGSSIRGEMASPTQPQSSLPPLVSQVPVSARDAWGRTAQERRFCAEKMSLLEPSRLFTPPSVRGTIEYPGSLGGVNWGSMAFDPHTGLLYANVNRLPFLVRLGPAKETWWHDNVSLPASSWLNTIHNDWFRNCAFIRWLRRQFYPDEGFQAHPREMAVNPHFRKEYSVMGGTPWTVVREPLVSPSGLPCVAGPWGMVSALDLNGGSMKWQAPLGTMYPGGEAWGSTSLGGPMVTAGGLVFVAAAKDAHLRAFDARSGALLWTGELPVPAQATPMSYTYRGKQYVVVAAGGHGAFGTQQGDAVVAFALP